jgi:hypothetical protein
VLDDREPLALVVAEFLAALQEDRPPRCGPRDDIAVLSVLEAATGSAATGGEWIDVPTSDDLPDEVPV